MEHTKNETHKSSFKCKHCSKDFDSLASLKIHEESHQSLHLADDDLKKLKEEIIQEVDKKKPSRLAWGNIMVSTILVILTLFSLVQTVQSAYILNKIKGGAIKPASASSSSNSLPNNLENLPNMVGGC